MVEASIENTQPAICFFQSNFERKSLLAEYMIFIRGAVGTFPACENLNLLGMNKARLLLRVPLTLCPACEFLNSEMSYSAEAPFKNRSMRFFLSTLVVLPDRVPLLARATSDLLALASPGPPATVVPLPPRQRLRPAFDTAVGD